MLSLFRKKRVITNSVHFVRGEVLTPGATSFQPIPTVADPAFHSDVAAERNFISLAIVQPAMDFQSPVAPPAPSIGFAFDGKGLMQLDPHNAASPDISGDYYS